MRRPIRSSQFKRDVKRAGKQGKNLAKLRLVLSLLLEGKPLPPAYQDHPLKGPWKGYRDVHMEPDWLLIYRADDDHLWLARTGSHADLFER